MGSKKWIIGWLSIVILLFGAVGFFVYRIDPFMHYHKPDTSKYYYTLNNQRSQNDGIIKHFDYDAMITGSSMTENFMSSEMDKLFDCHSIKVPFAGGTYKEINDNVRTAIEYNPNLKIVLRGIDIGFILLDKDEMKYELKNYPSYLYDRNPFNDVQYIWNRDVIWDRAYKMTEENNCDGFEPGINSFDVYSNCQNGYSFGVNSAFSENDIKERNSIEEHLSAQERTALFDSVEQNLTSIARDNPDITFYYFISPYSVIWWNKCSNNGTIYKFIEAEQYAIELMNEYDNIKLYSFNNRYDIITDLNNYRDYVHYAQWINSLMLRWIKEGKYQITKDNYEDYIQKETAFYTGYDYSQLNNQVDYENDYYAAALLNEELTGLQPFNILDCDRTKIELKSAEITPNLYDGNDGIVCKGSLKIDSESNEQEDYYIRNDEYVGAKLEIDDIEGYGYLVCYGKRVSGQGQASIYAYDEDGFILGEAKTDGDASDKEWQQYVINIADNQGKATIYFNGDTDYSLSSDASEYIFSNIMMY